MNDKRFPKILKGLAVCAGYAAAFLGLMAVKAALIILLCIGLLMGATRACLTEHASPHRRGEVVRYLESAYLDGRGPFPGGYAGLGLLV